MEMIKAYVEKVQGKTVEWGVDDCCIWPGSWWELKTGNKLKFPEYSSRSQAYRLIKKANGLVNLWDEVSDGLAKERFSEPLKGDVGIIETNHFGQVGGIFGERGLFFWRTENGFKVLQPRPKTIVKMWQT